MRGRGLLLVAALSLPLAGCLGITIPPKALPDWAMQPQAREPAASPDRVVRRKAASAVVQRGVPRHSAAVSYVGQPGKASDATPFSPEWTARENALDDRLRRGMHICNNC